MIVEVGSKRCVIDPWLAGPVYWESWFHCPAPVYDDAIFDAAYIYITHWHFDHLHTKSLARFRKDCHLFVPRFPVSSLVKQLRKIGFENITEMAMRKPML